MGGSSAPRVQQQSIAPQLAALGLQSNALQGDLTNRAQMLLTASQIKPQQSFADIWGQSGAYGTSKDTAYLNAVNSRALQQAVDPIGAKIRQNTESSIAQLTDPAAVQAAAKKQFAQETLPGMYGTGLENKSTIYGSGLFDRSTLAGLQLQQSLAQLGQPYMQTPQTGLDPSVAASIPIQQNAQTAAQGNAFLQGILGGGGSLEQSLEQGQNSLYSNLGQTVQSQMANQLGIAQANQASSAQAQGNKLAAAGAGAGTGALAGSAFGPYGTAAGALIGGVGGYLA